MLRLFKLVFLPCAVLVASSYATSAFAAVAVYGVRPTLKLTQEQSPTGRWSPGQIALDCARNEGESFQAVFRSTAPVANSALQVSDLRGPGKALIPASAIDVRLVQWVDVNAPFEVTKPSTNPDFQPDPLPPVKLATDRFAVTPGQNVIFWLTVFVPETARPGQYQGTVQLVRGGASLATLAVSLQVWSFALPREPILQSMIGLSAGNIYKAHGCKTVQDKEKVIRLYFDAYIRARLSPFLYAPGTMAFNPLPDGAIKWQFVKDAAGKLSGEVKLDFSGFDREGDYYLNQRHAFSSFNFAPYLWARRSKGKKDIYLRFADSSGTVVDRRNADGSVNPVFDRLVIAYFRGIAAHLAKQGWLDRAIYYVTDEPADSDVPALKQICELVRQADPRIRTAMTYDPATRPRLAELVENGKSLVSVWIPYCSSYREDVAAQQRKKGARYWLYDVKDNALITDSGLQNRAMFWDVWRRGADGYLYYQSTYWGRQATVWERPNFLLPGVSYRYAHGDGYFFYPPLRHGTPTHPILDHVVPSIRWELMREGAEDYDYLRMLQRLTDQATQRNLPAAAQGQRALAEARKLADNIAGAASSYAIRDLTFKTTDGWSWGEGWLTNAGGARSDLPIQIKTSLPDGRYQLLLNVYRDSSYRGRAYSHFAVNGHAYSTSPGGVKGSTTVPAGIVEVRGGVCKFTLSSVAQPFGVILYHVGLKPVITGKTGDLYAVRAEVAEALEALGAK